MGKPALEDDTLLVLSHDAPAILTRVHDWRARFPEYVRCGVPKKVDSYRILPFRLSKSAQVELRVRARECRKGTPLAASRLHVPGEYFAVVSFGQVQAALPSNKSLFELEFWAGSDTLLPQAKLLGELHESAWDAGGSRLTTQDVGLDNGAFYRSEWDLRHYRGRGPWLHVNRRYQSLPTPDSHRSMLGPGWALTMPGECITVFAEIGQDDCFLPAWVTRQQAGLEPFRPLADLPSQDGPLSMIVTPQTSFVRPAGAWTSPFTGYGHVRVFDRHLETRAHDGRRTCYRLAPRIPVRMEHDLSEYDQRAMLESPRVAMFEWLEDRIGLRMTAKTVTNGAFSTIEELRDATGRTLRFDYETLDPCEGGASGLASGCKRQRLVRIGGVQGDTIHYRYDSEGRLAGLCNGTLAIEYTYGKGHDSMFRPLVQVHQNLGLQVARVRIKYAWFVSGAMKQYEPRMKFHRPVRAVDDEISGHKALIYYASVGGKRQRRIINGGDGIRLSSLDEYGRLLRSRDRRIEWHEGSDLHIAIQESRRDGKYQYEYDDVGNAVQIISPDLRLTLLRYDEFGQEIERRHGPSVERVLRDEVGREVERRLPDGRFTRSGYDDLGDLSWVIDESGDEIAFQYDSRGNVETRRYRGGADAFKYDSRGWLRSSIAEGTSETYEYDPTGRRL